MRQICVAVIVACGLVVAHLIAIPIPSFAQQDGIVSPDGKYVAVLVTNGRDKHYQIKERASGRIIFTTSARYKTPNDVKGGAFSPDSQKFAAIYHYGHKGPHTWIVVWWVTTGLRDSWWKYEGFLRTVPSEIFPTTSPPSANPMYADLVITSHSVSKGIVHTGEPFQYQVSFINAGSAASGDFVIRFWLNNAHHADVNAPSFGVGQQDLAYADFAGLSTGDHSLAVCLDADNQVPELNENNNCTSYGLQVWPPFTGSAQDPGNADVSAADSHSSLPTLAPTPTNTPAPFQILAPAYGACLEQSAQFEWVDNIGLRGGHVYEIVVWRSGEDPLRTSRGMTKVDTRTSRLIDLNYLDDQREWFAPGEYEWGVLEIIPEPYQRIRLLSSSKFTYVRGAPCR
jgi:hypothetical protein